MSYAMSVLKGFRNDSNFHILNKQTHGITSFVQFFSEN